MTNDTISLATARAARSGNAADWGPKDVLLDCLKRLGNEGEADAMVVVWRCKTGPGQTTTHFAQCGPDLATALGLLSAGAFEIYHSADDGAK